MCVCTPAQCCVTVITRCTDSPGDTGVPPLVPATSCGARPGPDIPAATKPYHGHSQSVSASSGWTLPILRVCEFMFFVSLHFPSIPHTKVLIISTNRSQKQNRFLQTPILISFRGKITQITNHQCQCWVTCLVAAGAVNHW